MPMWTCDFAECNSAAVRGQGDCVLCNRHLCSRHLQSEAHTCPRFEDVDAYFPAAASAESRELRALVSKINIPALTSRASTLRGGMPCSARLDPDPSAVGNGGRLLMGGMNYHIPLVFSDGTEWLARVRRGASGASAKAPPRELRDHILLSEVATLRLLARTTVPTPRVHDFALEDSPAGRDVGVGYILTEKLPGSPLDPGWNDSECTTAEQKERVLDQLADVHSPPREGDVDNDSNNIVVGPFARESETDFVIGPTNEMRPLGPFQSWEEYRRSSLNLTLDLILRGELYCTTTCAVDAYLIHRYLIDLLPLVVASSPPPSLDPTTSHTAHPSEAEQKRRGGQQEKENENDERGGDSGQKQKQKQNNFFYLTHADAKGDHILVDSSYTITGILDWEWSYTAPAEHAFNSPIALLPIGDFYAGVNSISDDESLFARLLEEKKGRPDLAQCVRNGRVQHRFDFCCGHSLEDWDGFLGLFKGLRDAVKVGQKLDWESWKSAALGRYKEDAGLQVLLGRQESRSGA
ncbi:hypothetical protein F5Y17DRAFT_410287 [Xylariaceae sp. FL0594]|nr:hypothetical protein F5Y17DRAFT_410287 [Xylariaceae sp. FL0594]